MTERALNAEMDHHLAGEDGAGNMRNGYGRKTVMTGTGKLALDVPRDRQASFDPQPIARYQRRFPGFDEKIVSMYARGMSTREITGHLHDLYGIEAVMSLSYRVVRVPIPPGKSADAPPRPLELHTRLAADDPVSQARAWSKLLGQLADQIASDVASSRLS